MLIAFTLWLLLQSLWAISPSDHSTLASMYVKYIILFFLMHRILVDEKSIIQFSLAHVIGCAYYGWLAFRTAGSGRFEYIGGPNMDGASGFSAQMATGLIFAGVMLFQTRGYIRILILFAIPFILNGIILTQSRGGFLGLLAGGLTVLYLSPHMHRKAFYSAGALALFLFLFLAHDVFWERMETIINAAKQENIDGSAESRWVLLDAQWEMFKLNPVLGSGHRGTAELSPLFMDERWLSDGARSSHNTFMTLLVEQGILGAMMYFSLMIWAAIRIIRLKSLARKRNSDSLGLMICAIGGALASLLVAGQFADLLRLEVTIWCLVLLAIVSQNAANDRSGASKLEVKSENSIKPPDNSVVSQHVKK
jgi:O-antigen ligase